jgi:DNA primase
VAGRIRDEDLAAVRDASGVADVIGEHIQLRSAGGGNLKGLCPFHDEKSPSFNVTPVRGLWHCFGCGEGGDVISFVMKLDHLSFNEAVEQLAKRARIELRYAEGGFTKRNETSERARLLEAHRFAADYYVEQLDQPGARHGREFLAGRGFEREVIARFGVGYAPDGWDNLVRHLRGRGFTDRELLTAGLSSEGRRGPIDRFRDRLVWPIAEAGGEVIGFGARRLNDDPNSPKYLNTPETPLYKKSSVLYGLDLARREIAKQERAVVVEGYTDVMACHLAGEGTAIATCGTAFGEEHIKILRRLLGDRNQYLGYEVIFTFDGDSAGQKAALRAFLDDQRFVTQTFVAVQPDGMDPCELRIARGDAAIRDLISARIPLFEFAIRARLSEHDIDSAEGRVRALRATAPVVASIRDHALRPEYGRRLAGWLGMDEQTVAAEVRRSTARGPAQQQAREIQVSRPRPGGAQDAAEPPVRLAPAPTDSGSRRQREALKLALQFPQLAGAVFDGLEPDEFTDPGYCAVRAAIAQVGGVAAAVEPNRWLGEVTAAAADAAVRTLITQLAVEQPMVRDGVRGRQGVDARYVTVVLTQVRIDAVQRYEAQIRSRLQRLDADKQPEEYLALFTELNGLVRYRVDLTGTVDQ